MTRPTFPDAPLTAAEIKQSITPEPELHEYEVEVARVTRYTVEASTPAEAEETVFDGDRGSGEDVRSYVVAVYRKDSATP